MVVQWKTYIESENHLRLFLTCTRFVPKPFCFGSPWARAKSFPSLGQDVDGCSLRGNSSYKWTISIQEVIVLEPGPAVPVLRTRAIIVLEPTTHGASGENSQWLGMPNTDISGVTPAVLEMSTWENMKHHFPITLFFRFASNPSLQSQQIMMFERIPCFASVFCYLSLLTPENQ